MEDIFIKRKYIFQYVFEMYCIYEIILMYQELFEKDFDMFL